MLLEGASTIAVDAKGRIAIPARYRDDLEQVCEGKLHITRHFREDCLLLFPESEWVTFRTMVAAWPNSAAWQKRRILGNAMPVELDTASRILLSPDLREEVQMGREAKIIGNGSHFEIWDMALFKAKDAASMQQPDPEFLDNLSF